MSFRDIVYGFFESIEDRQNNTVNALWRPNTPNDVTYRVNLVAHEEAVLNAALAAANGSEEREKYIKQYRFLRDYRTATSAPEPLSKAELNNFAPENYLDSKSLVIFKQRYLGVQEFRDRLTALAE